MPKKPRPLPFSWVEEWREDPELPPGVRCVIYALAMYMDARGVAWPSVTTLARDTGYSRRQLFRHLDTAHRAGWLGIDSEAGPTGNGGKVNLYEAMNLNKALAQGGDAGAQGGDAHVMGVVTPMSPERSVNAQGTSREILTGEAAASENGTRPTSF